MGLQSRSVGSHNKKQYVPSDVASQAPTSVARLTRLRVQGYRSIGAPIDVAFPNNAPLVLFGQNNCGKSNITKALELILGGSWPGNHEPDEHEFFGRQPVNPIAISVFADEDDPIGGGGVPGHVENQMRHSSG
jgi:hypothetical protein